MDRLEMWFFFSLSLCGPNSSVDIVVVVGDVIERECQSAGRDGVRQRHVHPARKEQPVDNGGDGSSENGGHQPSRSRHLADVVVLVLGRCRQQLDHNIQDRLRNGEAETVAYQSLNRCSDISNKN